jgi:hypothetical protein
MLVQLLLWVLLADVVVAAALEVMPLPRMPLG